MIDTRNAEKCKIAILLKSIVRERGAGRFWYIAWNEDRKLRFP